MKNDLASNFCFIFLRQNQITGKNNEFLQMNIKNRPVFAVNMSFLLSRIKKKWDGWNIHGPSTILWSNVPYQNTSTNTTVYHSISPPSYCKMPGIAKNGMQQTGYMEGLSMESIQSSKHFGK